MISEVNGKKVAEISATFFVSTVFNTPVAITSYALFERKNVFLAFKNSSYESGIPAHPYQSFPDRRNNHWNTVINFRHGFKK
jgi:hypothetical protein